MVSLLGSVELNYLTLVAHKLKTSSTVLRPVLGEKVNRERSEVNTKSATAPATVGGFGIEYTTGKRWEGSMQALPQVRIPAVKWHIRANERNSMQAGLPGQEHMMAMRQVPLQHNSGLFALFARGGPNGTPNNNLHIL